MYMKDPNFVITETTDALKHSGARPSRDRVLNTILGMFSSKFYWLSWLLITFWSAVGLI